MDRRFSGFVRRGVSLARPNRQPKQVSASAVRKSFLDFFCLDRGHYHIRSSPVFSLLDPTLAFVNAGMNQFKDVFLGLVRPASTRVANCQKCIRVGGKHNDLSQVGRDGTHHSFFEMLGNWSFGDYFKREACAMSWDLLTKVYRLPADRLYVTYFSGDDTLGLGPDTEVREIWREIGVKDSHIIASGAKDNFWEMGTTGPCGVSTEIHYDHVEGRKEAGSLVNAGREDLTELWNLVFIEFNREQDGHLSQLRQRFVDTGMGFERLVAVLQGKTANYDTDLFYPLFDVIKSKSGHSGYTGDYGDNEVDRGYRIIADHARMIAVALADGMIPNHQNKVRTIIRKALDVCGTTFKSDRHLLNEVVNRVADTLADAYAEIGRNLPKIRYLIEAEDETLKSLQKAALRKWKQVRGTYPDLTQSDFLESPQLMTGIEYLKRVAGDGPDGTVTGEHAWRMFDTLGIRPEATEKLTSILGLKYDPAAFDEYEKTYKARHKVILERQTIERGLPDGFKPELFIQLERNNVSRTNDSFRYDYRSDSSGKYIFRKQSATVVAIIRGGEFVDRITSCDVTGGERIGLVLDRTQLLAEDETRDGDSGTLVVERGIVMDVEKVVKVRGYAVHLGRFKTFPRDSTLTVDNIGVIDLNEEKRLDLMRNQTGLNLLKAAVREKVHVTGERLSRVTSENLSLDFMVYKDKVQVSDVADLEEFVRRAIRHDVAVTRRPMTHGNLYELDDVVCQPGKNLLESEVPVVEISSGLTLIRECCTGAHVLRTSDLVDFVVTAFRTSFYSVKRIEGVTGARAVAIRQADAIAEEKYLKLRAEAAALRGAEPEKVTRMVENLRNLSEEVSKSDCHSYVVKSRLVKELEREVMALRKLDSSESSKSRSRQSS